MRQRRGRPRRLRDLDPRQSGRRARATEWRSSAARPPKCSKTPRRALRSRRRCSGKARARFSATRCRRRSVERADRARPSAAAGGLGALGRHPRESGARGARDESASARLRSGRSAAFATSLGGRRRGARAASGRKRGVRDRHPDRRRGRAGAHRRPFELDGVLLGRDDGGRAGLLGGPRSIRSELPRAHTGRGRERRSRCRRDRCRASPASRRTRPGARAPATATSVVTRQVSAADRRAPRRRRCRDRGLGVVDGHAGSVPCRRRVPPRPDRPARTSSRRSRSARARDDERLAQRLFRGRRAPPASGAVASRRTTSTVAGERHVREAVVEEMKGDAGRERLDARARAAPRLRSPSATMGTPGSARARTAASSPDIVERRRARRRRPRRRPRAAARPAVAAREDRRGGSAGASSPASQRTNGVFPVPPAARLPTEITGRPGPADAEEPAPVEREAAGDPRAVGRREGAEEGAHGGAPDGGESRAASAARRARRRGPRRAPRTARSARGARRVVRAGASRAPSAAERGVGRGEDGSGGLERVPDVPDGRAVDDRSARAERLEDVVSALRREGPAEERRLGERVRPGELADRVEEEDVGARSVARLRRERRTTASPLGPGAPLHGVEAAPAAAAPGRETLRARSAATRRTLEDEGDLARRRRSPRRGSAVRRASESTRPANGGRRARERGRTSGRRRRRS